MAREAGVDLTEQTTPLAAAIRTPSAGSSRACRSSGCSWRRSAASRRPSRSTASDSSSSSVPLRPCCPSTVAASRGTRATGGSIINASGQIGALIAGVGITASLASGTGWEPRYSPGAAFRSCCPASARSWGTERRSEGRPLRPTLAPPGRHCCSGSDRDQRRRCDREPTPDWAARVTPSPMLAPCRAVDSMETLFPHNSGAEPIRALRYLIQQPSCFNSNTTLGEWREP